MKKEYKARLQVNLTYLEETLQMDPLVDICYEKQILKPVERERIQAEKSRPDKALVFVRILRCKANDSCYESFLEILCDPRVGQPFIKKRLEESEIKGELSADVEEEKMLEEAIKNCFIEEEGKECLKENFVNIIRQQLRYQQKSLNFYDAEILTLTKSVFPKAVMVKNKKRHVITIQNISVQHEIARKLTESTHEESMHGREDELKGPIALKMIAARDVAIVIRSHFKSQGLDKTMADAFEEQDIDGEYLAELTEDGIKELFPGITMGKRRKVFKAVKSALEELQKNPERKSTRRDKSPTKLETYREFDKPLKHTDVYEKDYILPEEQLRPGSLLIPIHRYCTVQEGGISSLAKETVRFAAACMNERANGTIHFGVASWQTSKVAGQIEGINFDKQQCEDAITNEIYHSFFPDQLQIALRCIRNPVFIPVAGRDLTTEHRYVLEVDIVPNSEIVANQAFFLHSPDGAELLRYQNGEAKKINGEKLNEFMDFKKKLTAERGENEKVRHEDPLQLKDLHRKLHHLLTNEHEYKDADIFPLLFLSPCASDMTNEYLAQNFECMKSLKPLAVFDFEIPLKEDSISSGLCKIIESQLGQTYNVYTTDNFDKKSDVNKSEEAQNKVSKLLESIEASFSKSWIMCNGYAPLGQEELEPADWISNRMNGYEEALRFYMKQIPAGNARVLIFLLSKNYEVLMCALREVFAKFSDQWIILAESDKIANPLMSEILRRNYVKKHVLEERIVIGMPWSHVNISLMKIFGFTSGTGCTLPTSTGSGCVMKERERNELQDLEILSMYQCEEDEIIKKGSSDDLARKKRKTEDEFYHGKAVSWWNFYFQDHVLERVQAKELSKRVSEFLDGKLPEDEKVGVVTLHHQKGSGGTTTAHQVLWEFRDKTRCCVIKHITNQTCEQIARFRIHEEPAFPKPPLILVDNEDAEKVFRLIAELKEKARREARINKGDFRVFCVVIRCIRKPAFLSPRECVVTLKHELQPNEIQWFHTKNQTLEKKYERKEGSNPKLLISFNIMKENFNPDYIKRTVDEFINEIHSIREKCLLKYIALINSFDTDFRSIPLSCFNEIMCPVDTKQKTRAVLGKINTAKGDANWQGFLSDSLNVLLNRTSKPFLGGDIKAVRIINNCMSREILSNLCQRDKQQISDVVLELFHSPIFRKSNESGVQQQLTEIVKDMLKKRSPKRIGREKFSPIILEIKKMEGDDKVAQVLTQGFDLFEDPYIAQLIARIYICCQNWKKAEEFAQTAQNMNSKNSYLCDTCGQVYKEQLLCIWNDCVLSGEQLNASKAKDAIDKAFIAIDIFQREQKLSDEEHSYDFNISGYLSELCVITTLLDICRHFKPFNHDGKILHRFLVTDDFIPPGLPDYLEEDQIKRLKHLYYEYSKPMRRLDEEQIQVKEDSSVQYHPAYSNQCQLQKKLAQIQECLDAYFGEESDLPAQNLSKEGACEFRRRRVRRLGGRSLNSLFELQYDKDAPEKYKHMFDMIQRNVTSDYCTAFDLLTTLNLVLASVSLNCLAKAVTMQIVLEWTEQLFDKAKSEPIPYLESYLYLVMFHWPTKWRNSQNIPCCSPHKIKGVIKEWVQVYNKTHSFQREDPNNKYYIRKPTTLFFLGQGEGFKEIVFQAEFTHWQAVGESVWDTRMAKRRLKWMKGTLCYGGTEITVKVYSADGNAADLSILTSLPITDTSMWQKTVCFVLGFCWSGPKAYAVIRDYMEDTLPDASQIIPPHSSELHAPSTSTTRGLLLKTSQAGVEFWQQLEKLKFEHEEIETKIRVCLNMDIRQDLLKKTRKIENKISELINKRNSFLQNAD